MGSNGSIHRPPSREQSWQALSKGPFDILFIGGGITGAGAAREAARRGLKVALVERSELASGTSSRSSRLIHGGMRYLQNFELKLVFESVSERRVLLQTAPHLVRPLPFLFPVYNWMRPRKSIIGIGMWMYDALSLFRSPKTHSSVSARAIEGLEPDLLQTGLTGGFIYYDCKTDDGRLTIETLLDAEEAGAIILSHAEVGGLLKRGSRVTGAHVRDRLADRSVQVEAQVVVNATGPWTDHTRRLQREDPAGASKPAAPVRGLLRPTRGVHIVVPHARLPISHAIVLQNPEDRRVMFAIPWREHTYIGTTDTDDSGDPGQVHASAEDVRYLLKTTHNYFPRQALADKDIVSTWAGLRPLIDDTSTSESGVSREHKIVVEEERLLTVAGGKLTTYRLMGEEIVEHALELLRKDGRPLQHLKSIDTSTLPLPGGIGLAGGGRIEALAGTLVELGGGHLSARSARHLADTYGHRAPAIARMVARDPEAGKPILPALPDIWAQVDWSVQYELAVTLVDVLRLRTQIFLRAGDQALQVAPRVALRMGGLLGWDEAERHRQLQAYQQVVDLAQRWRRG